MKRVGTGSDAGRSSGGLRGHSCAPPACPSSSSGCHYNARFAPHRAAAARASTSAPGQQHAQHTLGRQPLLAARGSVHTVWQA